jgi:hypothetical protein
MCAESIKTKLSVVVTSELINISRRMSKLIAFEEGKVHSQVIYLTGQQAMVTDGVVIITLPLWTEFRGYIPPNFLDVSDEGLTLFISEDSERIMGNGCPPHLIRHLEIIKFEVGGKVATIRGYNGLGATLSESMNRCLEVLKAQCKGTYHTMPSVIKGLGKFPKDSETFLRIEDARDIGHQGKKLMRIAQSNSEGGLDVLQETYVESVLNDKGVSQIKLSKLLKVLEAQDGNDLELYNQLDRGNVPVRFVWGEFEGLIAHDQTHLGI